MAYIQEFLGGYRDGDIVEVSGSFIPNRIKCTFGGIVYWYVLKTELFEEHDDIWIDKAYYELEE